FFAGVQRVVDGFLHGRKQRLARIVETEQMPVLGKKFTDGDVALLRSHGLGSNAGLSLTFVIFHMSGLHFGIPRGHVRSARAVPFFRLSSQSELCPAGIA